MRRITIPSLDWNEIAGVRAIVPVVVDWPELQLTMDQIFANVLARQAGLDPPFEEPIIAIEIARPRR